MLDDPRKDDEVFDLERLTLRRIIGSLEFAQRLAGLGAWEWDLRGDRLWWSDEVFDIFGLDPTVVTPDYDVFLASVHPEDRDRVDVIVTESMTSETGHYDAEYRIRRPDETVRNVHALGEVVRDETGHLLRMLGTVLDVTDRVEAAERERARSDELAGALLRAEHAALLERRVVERERAFLGSISHELRTPLTVLEGVAQTLGRVDLDPDDRRTLTASLATHVGRLSALIEDLLLVAEKPDEPAQEWSALRVDDLVHRVVARFADRTDVRLVGVDGVTVVVDRRLLARSLHALVDNATRYGGGGPVDLSVRVVGQDLFVEVADRGPGIPQSARPDVFHPFARGVARVDHAPGTGVGLSVVRLCARAHGGHAEILDREGGGTLVRLRLCDVVPATDASG